MKLIHLRLKINDFTPIYLAHKHTKQNNTRAAADIRRTTNVGADLRNIQTRAKPFDQESNLRLSHFTVLIGPLNQEHRQRRRESWTNFNYFWRQ